MTRVAVIGGGCAGLAAAARLAEHQIPVTLFEAGRQLGGRARGIFWQGQTLDNGQHILLGAYSETLSLLKLAGVDLQAACQRLPLQLTVKPDFELRACRVLPAPLHILAGLLQASGLSWQDRWSAVRFMAWMRLNNFRLKQDESLAALLARQNQPKKLTRYLWEPICLAALNTPLNNASAQVFLNVLRDSFARAKADSDTLLPKLDFSALMADPLADYICAHGGQVKRMQSVEDVRHEAAGFELKIADEAESFSHVILAVSPFRLPDITQQLPALATIHAQCQALEYQPICTVYLQFDKHLQLPQPMIGLSAGLGQWVFDRGQLYGQSGLLAVVISAEGAHQRLTQEALADTLRQELATSFPALSSSLKNLLWHKVITERRATFACNVDLQRPPMHTNIPNLYLAGDYVAGDYPATIEGAARSGTAAAQAIIQNS
jgi:squalene-associated FAD-dependent desaturase